MKLSAYSNLTPQEQSVKIYHCSSMLGVIYHVRKISVQISYSSEDRWMKGDIILAVLVYSFEALSRHTQVYLAMS